MANQTFKLKSGLTLTPTDLATLLNPQAGDLACDINDNNKIKRYDANALTWVEVGSGGVGGTDILFVQDFESASLSTFTQTGLTLSQTDPLHGKISALLTHQAGVSPTNDQSFKQIIPVDRKFRGETMTLRLNAKSNASAGNVTINIYDETNAANIVASEQLKLSNETSGAMSRVGFNIPATCASISYTITALPEAGSPVTRIDDIIAELAVTSLLETSVEVPNVTSWQGYTPTFQGFGTPTNIEFEWRQVGENVEIRGKFTSGTPTAVEARVGLPAGLTSAGTGIIPSIQIIGEAGKSTASVNNLELLIEPSVTYVTFGLQDTGGALTKQNANALVVSSNQISLFASIPCAGLSATSTKTIPLTQSGLVQEGDSTIQLSGANGFNGLVRLFSTIDKNIGSDIEYRPATGEFVARTAGIYSVSSSEVSNSSSIISRLRINVNNTIVQRAGDLAATTTSAQRIPSVSWTGYLNEGDIVTISVQVTSENNGAEAYFTMSKQGSLKQVSVSSDQKITIPTSELRFEGASSRGSIATTIVKFDTLAKLRGDAFTVVNTTADGTYIQMKKAGKLDVSTSIYSTAASSYYLYLTKNQSSLISTPSSSEILSSNGTQATVGRAVTASWSGFVVIGDIIRVCTTNTLTADSINNLNLSFQEQDISVSVTNTLPQFSDSDSSVRVFSANGFGSTNTAVRRFSTLIENSGTDISYNDGSLGSPATVGDYFIVKSDGIYNISYSDSSSTASSYVSITKNQIDSTDSSNVLAKERKSTTTSEEVLNVSWSGKLSSGDIIRAIATAPAFGNDRVTFTISKVGKPNVTGVDVTPFVNVPQPVTQFASLSTASAFSGSVTITGVLTKNSNNGIFSYNSTTGVYTILKKANLTLTHRGQNASASAGFIGIDINSVNIVGETSPAVDNTIISTAWTGSLDAGDIFSFRVGSASVDNHEISVLATALSDQILTAPETFSSDTASFTYAGSGTYTLSTLKDAPIGTYITFTYAINSNTRTQTTTRPTQTDADMNTNGILLYTRAYNAASTAGNPAAIAIQIGKGMKGKSLDLYKSVGKVTSGSLDYGATSTANGYGAVYKDYNEITGILLVDAGYNVSGSNTQRDFLFSDISAQTSGYLVINASKNPALTGLGLQTVAARAVNTAGTTFTSTESTVVWDSSKTYDTNGALNATTGVFTAPESGYYQVSWGLWAATVTYAIGDQFNTRLYKNGVAFAYGSIFTADRAASIIASTSGTTEIFLAKNDTLELKAQNSRTGSTALSTNSSANYFSIHKTSLSTGN